MTYGLPSEWVRLKFDDYVNRCDLTMDRVFSQNGSISVELRAWLYETSVDDVSMLDTMHTEPLYTVAMFLGIEPYSEIPAEKEARYQHLVKTVEWTKQAVRAVMS